MIFAALISAIFNLMQFLILSYFPPLYYYLTSIYKVFAFFYLCSHINSVNRGMPAHISVQKMQRYVPFDFEHNGIAGHRSDFVFSVNIGIKLSKH